MSYLIWVWALSVLHRNTPYIYLFIYLSYLSILYLSAYLSSMPIYHLSYLYDIYTIYFSFLKEPVNKWMNKRTKEGVENQSQNVQ